MIPVYLLGTNQRRLLGSSVTYFAQVAAKRAGFPLVDVPPESGEVIVVDPDAAITAQTLTGLAAAPRIANGPPLVDQRRLVARIDATVLRTRRAASVEGLLHGAVEVVDVPVAPYRGVLDRPRAEEILLRGSTKKLLKGDHMGVLNREVTLPLVKPFALANIKPNTVTLISFAITLASFFPLAHGGYYWLLLGGFLQWVASLLDGVDGKLARLKGQTSPFGNALDYRLDMVYYVVLAGGLSIGLARTLPTPFVVAVLTVLGVGLLVEISLEEHMRRRLVAPDRPEQFGPLIYGLLDAHRGDKVIAVGRAAVRTVSRAGFPHIFFAAAILGVLPLLFAAGALAVHATWIIGMRLLRVATLATTPKQMVRHAA